MAGSWRKGDGEQTTRQRFSSGNANRSREEAPAFTQLAAQGVSVQVWVHALRIEKRKCLRRGDACETTLNRGFKWERVMAFGLPAQGGLARLTSNASPWS